MSKENVSRVCIVTAYTASDPDWKMLGEFTTKSMREYADRHKYDLKIFTDGFDVSRYPTWSKILFVKEVLSDYEWAWWLDADAIIANHKRTLDKYINSKLDILMCKDSESDVLGNMGTGSFFIRNCPFSFWLLDEIWKREEWSCKPWHEQSAFLDVFREGKLEDRLGIFDTREFNALCDWYAERCGKLPLEELQWHIGDFVAHCAGYWMPHRIEILKQVERLTIR